MLKLIIFDVDGTLVDSQALIMTAMTRAFADAGVALPPRQEVLGIVGLSLPEAMARLAPEHPAARVAALVEHYKRHYLALRQEMGGEASTPFYPGARDAIERLDEAGYLLSIATGKARRGLDHMLASHGLTARFIGTQTADDAPSKPHPQMVLNCLAATGVAPENALMIGDTEFDMAMARAAGARALGVTWGYHGRARLAAGGAERIVENYSALEGAVAEMLGAA